MSAVDKQPRPPDGSPPTRSDALYGGDDPPEWVRRGLRPSSPLAPQPEAPPKVARARRPGWIVSLFLVALLLAGSAYVLGRSQVAPADNEDGRVSTVAGPGPVTGNGREPVAAVAEAVLPSMVQIETDTGLGSGIVYDEDGFILTAAHVVEGADEVTVRLADGQRVDGRVVGAHDGTDVAVILAEEGNLVPATLATGVPLRVGQLAIAVGSPFGLEQTVTSGIVSALDRSIVTNNGESVTNMIQTDAPINPGNSGGALVDRQGRVIGINDAIASDSGVSAGVGFAIPIDTAATVANALLDGRTPQFGYLGVGGTETSTGESGVLVTEVQPSTPAERAGLQPGDIITAIDGNPIDDMSDLAGRVQALSPGTTVTLEFLRNGNPQTVDVQLARR
ncbi:MAG: trypsin-like peptidase domain-containing protein [Actinomycetota bacterium]|nr:trypsin-like peptidase domain-containing protein [Actinomycetota bacterium]